MNIKSTRTRILDAAAKALQQASDPFSVRPSTVSAISGISQSLIYYHFPETWLLTAHAAVRLLQSQVQLEVSANERFVGDSVAALHSWSALRLEWVGRNQSTCCILAFPKLFQLDQISEWRSTRDISRDLLAPHLMSHHGLTLELAQDLATACDDLSILPPHHHASERFQKLINQTVFQDQHVQAADSPLAGIK